MELVLRAYDHEQVVRAEVLPVDRLWTLLSSGGLRDRAKQRTGLAVEPDVWARETVVERLESLMQEGYGNETLARLRGAAPPEATTRRQRHWPPIAPEEAIALREDLVRYQTYGLWRTPEEPLARALAMLTQQQDAVFLLSGPEATTGLQAVLEVVEDDQRFAERFAPVVRTALGMRGGRQEDTAVQVELQRLQQLLGPAARLIRGAREVGLRIIAYQEDAEGAGLTMFLAADLERADRGADESFRQDGGQPDAPR